MSRENILQKLNRIQILTTSEEKLLKAQISDQEFMSSLICIYEAKVNSYLSSCRSGVKRRLLKNGICTDNQVNRIAEQAIIDFAYQVILERNKAFLLTSLAHYLRLEPQALEQEQGKFSVDDFESILAKIFVPLVARYQLFSHVGQCDIESLESESIFPQYLLDVFGQQDEIFRRFKQEASRSVLHQEVLDWPKWFAREYGQKHHLLLSHMQNWLRSVNRLFQKISTETAESKAAAEGPKLVLQLLEDSCEVCLKRMSSEAVQKSIFERNQSILVSDVQSICLPALSFLGITSHSDKDDIAKRQQELEQELKQIQARTIAIDNRALQLKKEAQQSMEQKQLAIHENFDLQKKTTQEVINALRSVHDSPRHFSARLFQARFSPDMAIRVNHYCASVLQEKGCGKMAKSYAECAYHDAKKYEPKNKNLSAELANHLGTIYEQLGLYKLAQKYHYKALNVYRSDVNESSSQIAYTLGCLALVYGDIKKWEMAFDAIHQAISKAQKENSEEALSQIYQIQGDLLKQFYQAKGNTLDGNGQSAVYQSRQQALLHAKRCCSGSSSRVALAYLQLAKTLGYYAKNQNELSKSRPDEIKQNETQLSEAKQAYCQAFKAGLVAWKQNPLPLGELYLSYGFLLLKSGDSYTAKKSFGKADKLLEYLPLHHPLRQILR